MNNVSKREVYDNILKMIGTKKNEYKANGLKKNYYLKK